MEKPELDYIEGLSPAISIEQKATVRNPRSTVGTVTEIHDYLRLLYAHIGVPHCWKCDRVIQKQTPQQIVDSIMKWKENTKMHVLAPIVRGRKGEHKKLIENIRKEGFVRIRVDGEVVVLGDSITLEKNKKHNIEIVIDRLIINSKVKEKLTESIELALKVGEGVVIINALPNKEYIFSEKFACSSCQISFEEIAPRMFSFNSPYGACKKCDGLGSHMEVDANMVVPDKTKSLIQGAIVPLGEQPRGNWYGSMLKSLSQHYEFNFTTPWVKLSKDIRRMLLYGTGDQKIEMQYNSKSWKGTYSGWRVQFLI